VAEAVREGALVTEATRLVAVACGRPVAATKPKGWDATVEVAALVVAVDRDVGAGTGETWETKVSADGKDVSAPTAEPAGVGPKEVTGCQVVATSVVKMMLGGSTLPLI